MGREKFLAKKKLEFLAQQNFAYLSFIVFEQFVNNFKFC